MTAANRQRIRDLCGDNTELADAILGVIDDDFRQHKAELAQLQNEGLQRAREKGTPLGRPLIKKPRKFARVYQSYTDGEISARVAAQKLNVSPGTFKRWVVEETKKAEEEAQSAPEGSLSDQDE